MPARAGMTAGRGRRRQPVGGEIVLVTGFGPFPGVPDNPSALLAEAVAARRRRDGRRVVARVLATEWETPETLAPLVATLRPRAILHVGVAPRAVRPRLESRAWNRVADLGDAAGRRPAGRMLSTAGPGVRRAPSPTLPPGMEGMLGRSRDPGAYLCNATLYRSLGDNPPWRPVAFLHIPPAGPRPGARIADLARIADAVIDGLVRTARPPRPARRLSTRRPPVQSKSAPRGW